MNGLSQLMQRFVLAVVLCAVAAPSGFAGETITYFHNDVAGSPMLATDSNGLQAWKETYRPYGDQLIEASASQNNDLWFTGKPYDESTGLSYFGARYYDPTLGRFMGIDPVGVDVENLHSANRYAYANNNPYKFVDPDGRLPILIPIAIIAWRAYSAYDTVTSSAANVRTLASSTATTGEKVAAGAELAGSLLGGKLGRGAAGGLARAVDTVDDAADTARDARVIYRQGDSFETATRLERKATEAENSNIKIHGVSGSTTKPDVPCSSATCGELEAAGFKVHDTPTRADPNHVTIELPKPVTSEDAQRFNGVLGRKKR